MPMTKKDWQDTRPSECKGSGVGEACATWAKACPKDPAKAAATTAETSEALKAIDEMSKALKLAEGKLAKCKDEKKVKATKLLIASWKKEVDDYQKDLSKAVVEANAAELKGKIADAEKHVNDILESNMQTIEMNIVKMLDDAEDALKKKDADACETKLTSAKRKLMDMKKLAKKGPVDAIKNALSDRKLPSGSLKVSDFSIGIKAIRSMVEEQNKRAAKLDDAWDALVDGASPTEPDTSKADPETKRKVALVLALYKATLKDLTDCQARAQAIFANSQKINGNPLIQSNPTGMVTVITKAMGLLDPVREDAKKVMFDIRESGGKCVTKRRELFNPDDAKPYVTFLTRAITVNGRMIGALSKAEDQYEEALEAIVAGGDPAAVGPAKALLAKLD